MKLLWYTLILLGLLLVSIVVSHAQDDPVLDPVPPGTVPVPPGAEPVPPKMLTFEQVLGYQRRAEQKQEEYLTQNGWVQGSDTPGRFIFWQLAYKGVEYRLEADQAIYVQRGITEEREQDAIERQELQSIGVQ